MKQALDLGNRIGIIGTVATSPAQIIEPLMVEAGRRGLGSDDLTLVTETRYVTLKQGMNQLQFSRSGTLIDPFADEARA